MGKQKGVGTPLHTEAEKIALSKRICEIYETQHCTIESAAESVGITVRSFHLWANQISEISETYKKAKAKSEEHFFEERLKPKLMTAMERLISDIEEEKHVIEELAHQGLKTGDIRTVTTKTRRDPNATAVIFGMKGAFPDKFAERTKTESTLTIQSGSELSHEQYAALKAIVDGG